MMGPYQFGILDFRLWVKTLGVKRVSSGGKILSPPHSQAPPGNAVQEALPPFFNKQKPRKSLKYFIF
jgi:hypothetical protein